MSSMGRFIYVSGRPAGKWVCGKDRIVIKALPVIFFLVCLLSLRSAQAARSFCLLEAFEGYERSEFFFFFFKFKKQKNIFMAKQYKAMA